MKEVWIIHLQQWKDHRARWKERDFGRRREERQGIDYALEGCGDTWASQREDFNQINWREYQKEWAQLQDAWANYQRSLIGERG